MATEPLARVAGTPARLASIIETAALAQGEDPHDEMFVRVSEDAVDTPASAPAAEQISYCTARAAHFDEVSVLRGSDARVLFAVAPALAWLDWLGERHERIEAILRGSHGVVTEFVLAAGGDEVRLPCSTDWSRTDISEEVVDRFDGERFIDEGGAPYPVRIETAVAELRRLVRAARIAECASDVPLTVRDGDLVIDIDDEGMACVEARLQASVDGPDCRNRYGAGLVRVVTAIEGAVTVQTGPGAPLAIVKDRPDYTLRYVIRPQSQLG